MVAFQCGSPSPVMAAACQAMARSTRSSSSQPKPMSARSRLPVRQWMTSAGRGRLLTGDGRTREPAGSRLAVGEDVRARGPDPRLVGIGTELVEEDERPHGAPVLGPVARSGLLPPAGRVLGGEHRRDRVAPRGGVAGGPHVGVVLVRAPGGRGAPGGAPPGGPRRAATAAGRPAIGLASRPSSRLLPTAGHPRRPPWTDRRRGTSLRPQ